MTQLVRQSEREALEAAVNAHQEAIAAHERATDALKAAVDARVPVAQLVIHTKIPRMTLLRRLGKVKRA